MVVLQKPEGALPVLALRNTVIYPGISQMLKVGREVSVHALIAAEKKTGLWIIAVQQIFEENKPKDAEANLGPEDLQKIGTLCMIDSMKGSPQEGYHVVLKGIERVELENPHFANLEGEKNYLEALSHLREDFIDISEVSQNSLLLSLKELSLSILKLIPANTDPIGDLINQVNNLPYLTFLCSANIEFPLKEKQKLLEFINLRERSLHLMGLLKELKDNLEIQAEIRGKLNQKLGKLQKNTILKEQIKAIQEELGEGGDTSPDGKLEKKIMEAQLPEAVRLIAEQEFRRLKEVGNQSPETHIIRNYLDLLVALPWNKSSLDKNLDLQEARRILDEDHFGLEKVKKRIIQQMAVYKLKKEVKGSILLFVGPPGVGKTSLGQSIARVLGRKFLRISLGGIRDDAEIRGHRRTYIGAMPGRFIQGFKRLGENNLLILLDEIDKITRSWNGDPASALLEALDSEQNHSFLDHYLDVGFDLSKSIFIATANTTETIPLPLLDRMEIIELTGYTLREKMHIAQKYLLPKQMNEFGLSTEDVQFKEEVISEMITQHTREAGVRELQRKLAEALRGVSEQVVHHQSNQLPLPICIEKKDIEPLLGLSKYFHEVAEKKSRPGIITGLAWSPVGGDILFIETSLMPGKGNLILTGQLGEVMKESAQISLSLVRAYLFNKTDTTRTEEIFDLSQNDVHIHVPSGATPKDGPSAGIAIFSSLLSLISKRSVDAHWAMSGEVTLRGNVMPVGGIKEKVIAAHRAGIQSIILPERNQRDLVEIPEEVKKDLSFHFVSHVDQLNQLIFPSSK